MFSWQFGFHSPLHIRSVFSCDCLKSVLRMFVCNNRVKTDLQTGGVPNNMGLNAACLTVGYLSVGQFSKTMQSLTTYLGLSSSESPVISSWSTPLYATKGAFKQSHCAVKVLMRNLQNPSLKLCSKFSTSLTHYCTVLYCNARPQLILFSLTRRENVWALPGEWKRVCIVLIRSGSIFNSPHKAWFTLSR